ncbi:alpha/beta fold hydrolase [Roseovarius atlanticus]|uniref:alpha/beta fold hydrolase n=1 Tax=Roseovarius atlanticus TaxID=1641875 RepID=UPI001C95FC69|nr:alpha/beta hydrolase [Roseovarius atlanticus]MBY5988732.1 alpha/beta hydrolase [Roseovarius atlanticus]MBY6124123.1 alpha/beta hydrolase [Roseovarius atlanticus]MBY6148618.1 alpha/beta hydrolase [Roseovarius atlanticus]
MKRGLVWVALGAVALLSSCAGLAGVKERTAEETHPPLGRFVEVDGTRVHVWVEGSGPDVVLIHGAGGNLRDFTFDLAKRLTPRYRVIAFDRPGLGYTERLPGYGGVGSTEGESPREQAALLQKAAAQIGVRRPVVVGHSFGGAVALAWGLNAPQDTAALVLLAGVSNPWPGELGTFYNVTGTALGGAAAVPLITALASEERIERSIEGTFAPQRAPKGYSEYLGPGLTLRRETLRANGQQVLGLRPHIVAMSQQYRDRLRMPVEIVHGDADKTVPLHVHSIPLSKQLRRGTLTVLEGVGHMPHHVRPQATVAAIDRAAARAGLR